MTEKHRDDRFQDKDLQDEGAAGASNADAANGAKDADAAPQRPKYRRKTKAGLKHRLL